MAKVLRLDVFTTMMQGGLVPLFYHDKPEVAVELAQAISGGGCKVLEFTNRGEKALPVFIELVKYIEEKKLPLILGVGSVIDPATAALFIANGANFIVGPSFNPEIARLCNRRKIGYIPGCATATEISMAEEAGAEIIKIFPGDTLGGPAFLKSILGPMPWCRIMPSGGVDSIKESVQGWLKAGACCVGMGSNLARKEWISTGNYAAIQQTVESVLSWVKEFRG